MKNPSLITSLAILLSCLSSSLNAQTTNGLQLWLKPEGLTNTVAASPISFWTDSSGGNYHATNDTGIKQPTYSTNALNGYAVAHFTGDGQTSANLNYLQSPLPFNSAFTNFTAIIVYKTTIPATVNPRCQLIHQVGGYANLYVLTSATTTNLFTSAANTA
ncbi:MAG: hypothetical protein ABIP71_13580, partial [Verrucomicrobiota bacterium]